MGGIFALLILLGIGYLFIWFFFKGGMADLFSGPPPDEISDEELRSMGLERWVKRRERWRNRN